MEWIPIVFITFKAIVLFTGMFFAVKWHYDQDRKSEAAASARQSRIEMRYFATMIIALAMSMIGIVYAGCWGNAADGGFGGALGCAFTAFMLFMSKPTAAGGLVDRIGPASDPQGDALAPPDPVILQDGREQLAGLYGQGQQLHAGPAARLDSVKRDIAYLSVAIIASILAWRYGSTAAAWLKF